MSAVPDPLESGSRQRASSPGAPTLVLVPTALERDRLVPHVPTGAGLLELCGFGPVAAAARAAASIARLAPRRVVLVGIAGTYDPNQVPIGSAHVFGEVVMDGVGAGEGPSRLTPDDLGLPQWAAPDGGTPVTDRLELADPGPRLVTVAAASGEAAQAADRRTRFDGAAEDMEAFAVALAAHLANTPCHVLRGISNVAGDRNVAGWQVDGALEAAGTVLRRILGVDTDAGGTP